MQANGIEIIRDPRQAAHLLEKDTNIACDLETGGLHFHSDPIAVVTMYGQDTDTLAVRRTTDRVVLDPHQATLDPGLLVSGTLQRFGYDAASGQVVVQYDGALSTAGGTRVETRRFTASVPADGTAASVGPALNEAANQVAADVAKWISGSPAN